MKHDKNYERWLQSLKPRTARMIFLEFILIILCGACSLVIIGLGLSAIFDSVPPFLTGERR